MVQSRERSLLSILKRLGIRDLKNKRILEVGCGSGDVLRDLIKWGAFPNSIVGMDLLEWRLSETALLCPQGVNILRGDAAAIPFAEAQFDVVMQSTVFTSVLDPKMKEMIAAEMVRVLKPAGVILWYDYHMNNPRNPDVQGVRLAEIAKLFKDCLVQMRRTTLAPPLTRLLAPYSPLLCCVLEKIPWLCTHYVGVVRKKGMDK